MVLVNVIFKQPTLCVGITLNNYSKVKSNIKSGKDKQDTADAQLLSKKKSAGGTLQASVGGK